MAEENYHARKTTEEILHDICRVVRSIEGLVGEIRDDLGAFLEGRGNGHNDYHYLDDDYDAGVIY